MMTKEAAAADFDIDALDAVDTADMVVQANGRSTTWVWTFAGPGHPQSIALSNKVSRERLRKQAAQEAAQVNGRKWKAEEESPEALARQNAEYIADRLLGWSPVKMAGADYPFTRENAVALLIDPKKGALAIQALEFLADSASFSQGSATN